MKRIVKIVTLLVAISINAQTLPLDFSQPEDQNFEAFNGTSVSYTFDPEDGTNEVMQIIGGNANFDGVSINLATYVDLSNDANNSITFRLYLPLDGSSSNDFLLKFEGSPTSNPTEIYFSTSGTGWQDITVDFGPGLSHDYPVLVLFTDATNGADNTNSATYFIDDIDGPNGDSVPVDAVPSEPANVPTTPDEDALSIYNDVPGYTNVWVPEYDFGTTQGEVDLGTGGIPNNALKFDFSIAGWGQGRNTVTDISEYNFVQFDYWADNMTTEVKFFIIDNNGAVAEYIYNIAQSGGDQTIVNESWVHVEIPLSFFEASGFSKAHFFQWKLDVTSNLVSEIVYLDNLYFSKQSLSLPEFSDNSFKVFPNPTTTSWHVNANQVIESIEVFDILGKQILKQYTNATHEIIPAENLSKGIYILTINTHDKTTSLKLIKK